MTVLYALQLSHLVPLIWVSMAYPLLAIISPAQLTLSSHGRICTNDLLLLV